MIEEKTAAKIVEQLGLQPHPEGGFFKESFRSPTQLTLPDGRIRSASTAIYFLLPNGTFSALHRVASDEIWHFYDGAPLELTTITPAGMLRKITLGRDIGAGQVSQHVVPAGVWQGAQPLPVEGGAKAAGAYSLVGCTVAPGFDFADFEMPSEALLVALFPQHAMAIHALTRG